MTLQLILAELSAPPDVQRWLDAAATYWNRHTALSLLAIGVVLLVLAGIGRSREWGALTLAVLFMTGLGALCASGATAMLGDEARKGRTVIRGDKVLNGPCKRDMDCASGHCGRVNGAHVCMQ